MIVSCQPHYEFRFIAILLRCRLRVKCTSNCLRCAYKLFEHRLEKPDPTGFEH